MKIASTIIVAAALAFASAPAFAHGGGMGGMGHSGNMGNMGNTSHNGVSFTQTQNTKTNGNNPTKTVTKTNKIFFLKHLKIVRIRHEIERLDREIARLLRHGKGNSKLIKKLVMQRNELVLRNVS